MIDESPIYFKIPSTLKDDFDVICKNSKTSKTMRMYEFIRNYVNEVKMNEPELLEGRIRKTPQSQTKPSTQSNDPFFGLGWR